jgi:hypothetical protein
MLEQDTMSIRDAVVFNNTTVLQEAWHVKLSHSYIPGRRPESGTWRYFQ